MGPTEVMLWGVVITELAEGLTRIIETTQRMQRGETVTEEDLAAARERTNQAMKRLKAAVESQANGTGS